MIILIIILLIILGIVTWGGGVTSWRFISKKRDNYEQNLFYIIALCTPNYDKKGCYGANILKKYAKKHNYKFKLYRELQYKNLSWELPQKAYLTKLHSVINAMENSAIKYIVLSDVDINIKKPDMKLEQLFKPDNDFLMAAPKDKWSSGPEGPTDHNVEGYINAGFMIFKNNDETLKLLKKWEKIALNECEKISRQQLGGGDQLAFNKCVLPTLKKGELYYLDHRLVGMPYSNFVSNGADAKKAWENWGKPDFSICTIDK